MTRLYDSVLCRDEGRRAALLGGVLNGIDTVEVQKNNQTTLHIFFFKGVPSGLDHRANLVTVSGGERVLHIRVLDTIQKPDHLDVIVDQAGDFSTYTLTLNSAALDPIFASVPFSFKAGCPSPFDCPSQPPCVESPAVEPLIDYYAKDYASFRRALLDWVSARDPNWTERVEADLGIALLELFAYAADQLSDYQDRVANEMYLGTARQRLSVRRHSALIDYIMHDGANAHTFVFVRATADNILPKPTKMTTVAETGRAPIVFETDRALALFTDLNALDIYTWSNADCCLPSGATETYLDGWHPNLQVGSYLLFEQVKSPITKKSADADRANRQIVQLTRVERANDPLAARDLTHIIWRAQDALSQTFCLTTPCADGSTLSGVTLARGNVVPAAHGETTSQNAAVPELAPIDLTLCKPPAPPALKQFRFRLDNAPLTFTTSANDPRDTTSSVVITTDDNGVLEAWNERRTLLESGPFDLDFVVGTDDEGFATVRFGDGEYGRAVPPGANIRVSYRVGNGAAGNVGAETLTQIPAAFTSFVQAVRNPLAATGGIDPEPISDVKKFAPEAFRAIMLRAVTAADYVLAAKKVDGVQGAAARFRWTGSWLTVFVSIDPVGRTELSHELKQKVFALLDAYRMAGYDLEIPPPQYVSLDLEINICVLPTHFRADVQKALLDVLSARVLPDGSLGFFHPDNFSFSEPLYLSRLYQAIEKVQGVQSAQVIKFQRWGKQAAGELARGIITTAEVEIIRLDNDPSEMEHGRLVLNMLGGK